MIKIHVPTEQYGYAEAEAETPEQAKELYNHIKQVFNSTDFASKLTVDEWNKALERYLSSGELHSEEYANMSQEQKRVIQEIKRAVKRIEYKNKN